MQNDECRMGNWEVRIQKVVGQFEGAATVREWFRRTPLAYARGSFQTDPITRLNARLPPGQTPVHVPVVRHRLVQQIVKAYEAFTSGNAAAVPQGVVRRA